MPTASPDTRRVAAREPALDGLRGVAALVVVVHHALLCVPSLAEPYYGGTPASAADPLARLLTWTPLHILWAGGEAVFVFFVLSGYVLMRWQERGFSLAGYYPQRLARLYLPVFAAVALGSLVVALTPRRPAEGMGAWLPLQPGVSWQGSLKDAVLVLGPGGVIPPLWSLQFEVLYSLAAPFVGFVVLWWTRRATRWTWVPIVAVVAFVAAAEGSKSLQLAAMFVLGASLPPVVDRLPERVLRARPWIGVPALVVALLLLTTYWWAGIENLALPTAGAGLLVVLAVTSAPTTTFLVSRPVRWLGAISFSLYLVHEPLEVLLGNLVGPGRGWWVLVVGVPVSLAAAWLFWRFAEAPAHRLSRAIGRRARARTEPVRDLAPTAES
jgi:peptidoglycan/LPS O-acetylase OafA/YrhL